MKEQLKAWAKEIRSLKDVRPLKFRGDRDLQEIEYQIGKLKYEFRHHHIAASELRGTPRSMIENPRENNKPNENYIERIKNEITESRSAA